MAYVYLTGAVIFRVVEGGRTRENAAALQSAVTMLESRYVSLSGALTLELARARGFHELSEGASFVSLPPPAGLLLTYRR